MSCQPVNCGVPHFEPSTEAVAVAIETQDGNFLLVTELPSFDRTSMKNCKMHVDSAIIDCHWIARDRIVIACVDTMTIVGFDPLEFSLKVLGRSDPQIY